MKRVLVAAAAAVLLFSISSAVGIHAQQRANQPATNTRSQTPPPMATIGTNPGPTIVRPPENIRFQNGTVLHYTAEWRLWAAGTATLRIDPYGSNQQKVSGTADSTGFVAVLYRVADRFESYFDRSTFCSLKVSKHTEEGLRRRETNIAFEIQQHKAILDEKNLRNDDTKHTEEPTPGCVTDVLSGIYYVGSLPLAQGAVYVFPLNDGGKTVEVQATVEGKEEIKTDAGTFQTIRVQPSSTTGTLKSKGKIWVWYTDDANHTPVQMRARMFWGTLTFKLARIDKQ